MENNEWKGLLQENFDSFEPEPSRDLWPEIENAIQPKRRVVLWPMSMPFMVAAAAAVLLLLVMGLWLMDNGSKVDAPLAKKEQVAPSTPLTPQKQVLPASPQPKEWVSVEVPAKTIQKEAVLPTPSPNVASPQQKIEKQLETSIPEEEMAIVPPVKKQVKALDLPVPTVLEVQPEINLAEEGLAVAISPTPLTIERPASPVVQGERHDIDLNDLNVRSVAAFASDRMEKMGVTTPVEVIEKEFSNSTSKTVKVGFNLFNVSHTRHKQFTIKKPDA